MSRYLNSNHTLPRTSEKSVCFRGGSRENKQQKSLFLARSGAKCFFQISQENAPNLGMGVSIVIELRSFVRWPEPVGDACGGKGRMDRDMRKIVVINSLTPGSCNQ